MGERHVVELYDPLGWGAWKPAICRVSGPACSPGKEPPTQSGEPPILLLRQAHTQLGLLSDRVPTVAAFAVGDVIVTVVDAYGSGAPTAEAARSAMERTNRTWGGRARLVNVHQHATQDHLTAPDTCDHRNLMKAVLPLEVALPVLLVVGDRLLGFHVPVRGLVTRRRVEIVEGHDPRVRAAVDEARPLVSLSRGPKVLAAIREALTGWDIDLTMGAGQLALRLRSHRHPEWPWLLHLEGWPPTSVRLEPARASVSSTWAVPFDLAYYSLGRRSRQPAGFGLQLMPPTWLPRGEPDDQVTLLDAIRWLDLAQLLERAMATSPIPSAAMVRR